MTVKFAYVFQYCVIFCRSSNRVGILILQIFFTEKMKFLVGFFGFIAARTECNGADYSPLGCFTDDPPFSVPGYRPSRMPQPVSKVISP